MHIRIEAMKPEDWERVRAIYEEGIATGNATFETCAPDWRSWDSKHLANCRLVARRGEDVVGWAALSHVSSRAAYRGVAEVSVYVAGSARGHGIGSKLLAALVEASELPESGPCRLESFRRMPPAWPCTKSMDSAGSGCGRRLAA